MGRLSKPRSEKLHGELRGLLARLAETGGHAMITILTHFAAFMVGGLFGVMLMALMVAGRGNDE